MITITKDWDLEVSNLYTESEETAETLLQKCIDIHGYNNNNNNNPAHLSDCMKEQLSAYMQSAQDEIRFHKEKRKQLAEKWEDYACEDNELETSEALREYVWHHNPIQSPYSDDEETDSYPVQVLHDYSSSQIHVLEDFISPEECEAVLEVSEERLKRAQVHDGQGGNMFSKHRKAWQAGIRVHWDLEEEGDLIAQVSRRVYDYTNHVLGFDTHEAGQEDLMGIQYFGNPDEDEEPDRYMPHCDGPCDGRPHKRGSRMATMVMYW